MPEDAPRSSAMHILEAAGFRAGRFGYTCDDFPGIEIPEEAAARMTSRDLLLLVYRESLARGRQLFREEIKLNVNAILGTSL